MACFVGVGGSSSALDWLSVGAVGDCIRSSPSKLVKLSRLFAGPCAKELPKTPVDLPSARGFGLFE